MFDLYWILKNYDKARIKLFFLFFEPTKRRCVTWEPTNQSILPTMEKPKQRHNGASDKTTVWTPIHRWLGQSSWLTGSRRRTRSCCWFSYGTPASYASHLNHDLLTFEVINKKLPSLVLCKKSASVSLFDFRINFWILFWSLTSLSWSDFIVVHWCF